MGDAEKESRIVDIPAEVADAWAAVLLDIVGKLERADSEQRPANRESKSSDIPAAET